jgi:hypothetical protein
MRKIGSIKKVISVISTAVLLGSLAIPAFASEVSVTSVVDTAINGSVNLTPGATSPIDIVTTVKGAQDATSTFEVYTVWTLSGGKFTGSVPATITVAPRDNGQNAPAPQINHTKGTIIVADNEGDVTASLTVSAFGIQNTAGTTAKLDPGTTTSLEVTCDAPDPIIPVAPTVTWPTATTITYGQTLAESSFTGGSAVYGTINVAGSFTFDQPSTVSKAGLDKYDVTFTPKDLEHYSPVRDQISVLVNKANPNVTLWPTTTKITYGQTLAAATMSGGDTSGSFAFCNPTLAPNAGTQDFDVIFTPTDLANYNTVTEPINVTVDKANAKITVTPYNVTYDGKAHTATGSATGVNNENLSGIDLDGTTHTNAGSYTDTYTFTDVTGNYNNVDSTTISDNISKADAKITVTPYNVTYDGNEHTATGSATGVNNENLSGIDLGGTKHTNAGSYTDTWTFTDATGNYNDDKGTVTDNIFYGYSGILQPINSNGSSVFKQGSTVPVQFKLVNVPLSVKSTLAPTIIIKNGAGSTIGSVSEDINSNPASAGYNFRYDSSSDQFIYNLGTKNSNFVAGKSYTVYVDLHDGNPIQMSATFSLK